jgi:hypothetical protein
MCDGTWRITLPELIAGRYEPSVRETTKYIDEHTDWPTYRVSVPVRCSAVSEEILTVKNGIDLFPCPAISGSPLNLSFFDLRGSTVEVFDIRGRKISSDIAYSSSLTITAPSETGVFLIRITKGDNVRIVRALTVN